MARVVAGAASSAVCPHTCRMRRLAVATASGPPYRVSANLRTYMNGASVVSAIAIDDQGIPSLSRPVSVVINQSNPAG